VGLLRAAARREGKRTESAGRCRQRDLPDETAALTTPHSSPAPNTCGLSVRSKPPAVGTLKQEAQPPALKLEGEKNKPTHKKMLFQRWNSVSNSA